MPTGLALSGSSVPKVPKRANPAEYPIRCVVRRSSGSSLIDSRLARQCQNENRPMRNPQLDDDDDDDDALLLTQILNLRGS